MNTDLQLIRGRGRIRILFFLIFEHCYPSVTVLSLQIVSLLVYKINYEIGIIPIFQERKVRLGMVKLLTCVHVTLVKDTAFAINKSCMLAASHTALQLKALNSE